MTARGHSAAGLLICAMIPAVLSPAPLRGAGLTRVKYNHPGLTADLGVGLWAWPVPMDFDGDGDLDLVVSCHDVPYNGTYFFENPGKPDAKWPVFKPPVRIGPGVSNIQPSYVSGWRVPRVLVPGAELRDFPARRFADRARLPLPTNIHLGKIRANQWKYVDFDGDGALDVIVGVGDWTAYGWDNAFDAKGRWTRGPLHGYVYLLRNRSRTGKPAYDKPVRILAGGKPIDVFGMPSPNLADFDGDGDLDIVCGEFVDKITYFENVGTRREPRYAPGRHPRVGGKPLAMDLCMIVPVAVDWDGDGDVDLVVGQEDGRVALIEHTGKVADGLPQFEAPRFFRQQADDLKFGALATPVGFDWDGDGDEDLLCGNTAGCVAFIENLDGGDPPRWAEPKLLRAGGRILRIQAGPNGSIQGPAEAKWGYTTLSVADWDGDRLPDLVVNSIWGKVIWFRNVGMRRAARLAAARPVEVDWPQEQLSDPPRPAWNWWKPNGKALATQWRTTPAAIDLNRDGLCDLVMLDHEGYLAFYERKKLPGRLALLPPKRIFRMAGPSSSGRRGGSPGRARNTLLRLNARAAGRSGRRKLCFVDWDGDGRLDLMVNSRNADWLQNVGNVPGPGQPGGAEWLFRDRGQVDSRRLAGHTTSPTVVDWDRDGRPDLLVGAEDGCFYHLRNPASAALAPPKPPLPSSR